jgi:hypothetical protein
LAKTPISQAPTKAPLIPKATDPRAELFYLLGKISDREEGPRITELVIDLTAPPATEGRTE